MNKTKLNKILGDHVKWLKGHSSGSIADLSGADLSGANLRYANLRHANLNNADLSGADLSSANLRGADLSNANLKGADLNNANLRYAGLRYADLNNADLRGANLWGADLDGADIKNIKAPHYAIVPEVGGFYAWKKVNTGIIKIYIPGSAKRTSTLISRKCRASHVKVISGPGCGGKSPTVATMHRLTYTKGTTVTADKFDDDIRIECTNGIHFFMTKKEAEEW